MATVSYRLEDLKKAIVDAEFYVDGENIEIKLRNISLH